MKKLILGYLLVTYGLLSQAQLFVRGKAVDKLRKEPLELAIIRSVNTETNTLSSKSGYFSLPQSRLKNEPNAVEEIHFTPGVPFFARLKLAVFF
jgi:hypothetical protein